MSALLSVKNLVKTYRPPGRSAVHALRGVDFELDRGQVLGVVGESGCGKSTLGRAILRLEEVSAGEIWFDGQNLLTLAPKKLKQARRFLQMIFQDPFFSLNPRMTIRQIVTEPLIIHCRFSRSERERRAQELLSQVGMPKTALDRYPHEFSGGQRQRISLARALAAGPKLLVADEPLSALDVTVQLQVLSLLENILRQQQLSLVFISHDLGVVREFCHHIAVMYLGRFVEMGKVPSVVENPLHPYTVALIRATQVLEVNHSDSQSHPVGEPPSASLPPSGCAFHPRCPIYAERKNLRCQKEVPELLEMGQNRKVACHELESR